MKRTDAQFGRRRGASIAATQGREEIQSDQLGTVPGFAGGWVAAVLFEQSGSWAMGFYACVVMSLVAAGIGFGLKSARRAVLAREAPVAGAVLAK